MLLLQGRLWNSRWNGPDSRGDGRHSAVGWRHGDRRNLPLGTPREERVLNNCFGEANKERKVASITCAAFAELPPLALYDGGGGTACWLCSCCCTAAAAGGCHRLSHPCAQQRFEYINIGKDTPYLPWLREIRCDASAALYHRCSDGGSPRGCGRGRSGSC